MISNRSCASLALALSLVTACQKAVPPVPPKHNDVHVLSANLFNSYYGNSALSSWKVRASAAGPQCEVLLVQVDTVLEDAMVLAMHHGEGAYDIYDGGVKQFAGERNFRSIAYLDKTGKLWKFGDVPKTLDKCEP